MVNDDEIKALIKAVRKLREDKAALAVYKGMDTQKINEKYFKNIIKIIEEQTKSLKKSHNKVLGLSEKLLNEKTSLSNYDFEILESASRALSPSADYEGGEGLVLLKPFKSGHKNMQFSVTVTQDNKKGGGVSGRNFSVEVLKSDYLAKMEATSESFAKKLSDAKSKYEKSVESNKGVTTSNQRGCIMKTKEKMMEEINASFEQYDERVKIFNISGSEQSRDFNANIIRLFGQSAVVLELLENFKPSGSDQHINLIQEWGKKLQSTKLEYLLDKNVLISVAHEEQQLDEHGYPTGNYSTSYETTCQPQPIVSYCGSQDWEENKGKPQKLIDKIQVLEKLLSNNGFEVEGSNRKSEIKNIQENLKTIHDDQTLSVAQKTQLARGCLLQHRKDIGMFHRGKLAEKLDDLLKTPPLKTNLKSADSADSADMVAYNKKFPKPKEPSTFSKFKGFLGKKKSSAYLDDTAPAPPKKDDRRP